MADPDWLHVATSGQIDRHDKCAACGGSMLYRVLDDGSVVAPFCGNVACTVFLCEIEEVPRG